MLALPIFRCRKLIESTNYNYMLQISHFLTSRDSRSRVPTREYFWFPVWLMSPENRDFFTQNKMVSILLSNCNHLGILKVSVKCFRNINMGNKVLVWRKPTYISHKFCLLHIWSVPIPEFSELCSLICKMNFKVVHYCICICMYFFLDFDAL